MLQAKIKIGRREFIVTENDLVLDNGNASILVTQKYYDKVTKWYTNPTLSKKLFKDLKTVGYLYTNDALYKQAQADSLGVVTCTYYKFDVECMLKNKCYMLE